MPKIVDYYFVAASPWSYLGHERFATLLAQHGATAAVKPVDMGRVFAASGGLPLAHRPQQRQSYRLLELARYSKSLGVPIDVQPKHFPVVPTLSSLAIVAATEVAPERAMDLAYAFMRAVWIEGRDIADHETIDAIVVASGIDANALVEAAIAPATKARLDANTDEAIAAEVFGAPTYVPRFGSARDQRFWGQDRLEFLADAIR